MNVAASKNQETPVDGKMHLKESTEKKENGMETLENSLIKADEVAQAKAATSTLKSGMPYRKTKKTNLVIKETDALVLPATDIDDGEVTSTVDEHLQYSEGKLEKSSLETKASITSTSTFAPKLEMAPRATELDSRKKKTVKKPDMVVEPSSGAQDIEKDTTGLDCQKEQTDLVADDEGRDTKPLDDLPDPEEEQDEEIRLAMEMAIAAKMHPHLSPLALQKLVGEKNEQAKIVEELAKQKEEKQKMEREKEREESARAWQATKDSWWAAAAKKAEEIKDQAERHLYADQIKKDREIIEIRRQFKVLKKTLKAHRLQGNRVETRHVFKRQRMEKMLQQTDLKLKKTQKMFTHSSYNVQEYLKAMMKATKKWRKKGSDDELMLEAQLCRNMHQMLALEKQKVKCKKNTKEMKKYLQRCKGWLSDKKAFCEMNLMTLEATQHSIMLLFEDTLRRQDALIARLKASDEFVNVDLSGVDLSHVQLPTFPLLDRQLVLDPMRGLPIQDSIRVKKGHVSLHGETPPLSREEEETCKQSIEEARAQQEILHRYQAAQGERATPELYVEMKSDCSVSSRLSDPDGSFDNNEEGSDSHFDLEMDAPWNGSSDTSPEDLNDKARGAKDSLGRKNLTTPSSIDKDKKPAARPVEKKIGKEDSPSTDSETPPTSEIRGSVVAAS